MRRVRHSLKALFSINPTTLTLGTTLLVVMLWATGTPLLDLIELKTYDFRVLSRGTLQPSPAVVMAVIDEKSLDAEGRWPWPRSKVGALVDILSRDGARVIGFDIAFAEADENSRLALIKQLGRKADALAINDPKLAELIGQSKKHGDNDLALATAIKNSSAAVVLGYFFYMDQASLGYHLAQAETDRQLRRISGSKYPIVSYKGPGTGVVPFMKAYSPESNLEMFTAAAAGSGYFMTMIDPDGVVRSVPLMIQSGQDLFPPLAVLCAWHYLGRPQLKVRVGRYGVDGVQMGDRFIPTDETGQLLINYLGPPKTFPYFSITDILRGTLPQGTFKDKIVLVGATAVGTHDIRTTPLSPVYPGIEIHATVIDNILTQDFMAKPRWTKVYDLLAIVALGALMGMALPWLGALRGVMLAAGLVVLYTFITRWLFVHSRMWLNMVYPLLAIFSTHVALTVYYYFTEERERTKIESELQIAERERTKIESELQIARDIQMSMVPAVFPPPTPDRPVEIYATLEPARQVGGDLYDFFFTDEGQLCFLIGDVSDKGTPAALFMAKTRAMVRSIATHLRAADGGPPEPYEIMARVNQELCRDNRMAMFVTLLLGVLDPLSGALHCCNAGHLVPYVLSRRGVEPLKVPRGRPLGIRADVRYESSRQTLFAGDLIFQFTDGITEAMDGEGRLFGEERLEAALRAVVMEDPAKVIAAVMSKVHAFAAGAPQSDDIAALAIRFGL